MTKKKESPRFITSKSIFTFHQTFVSIIGFLLVVLSVRGATNLNITDDNPMRMLPVGSYGLRILSPTLLELTLITTKQPDPATVTEWNFVNSSGALSAPSASQFTVTAGTQTLAVQSVGFKRRPLFAPLQVRDLRIENHLYLQLASAISDGQAVEVKNPNGSLWSTNIQFTAQADPSRWSPAIHVNQEGYMPAYSKKAMVSYYIGSMGEMAIPSANGFKIVDAKTGTTVYSGALTQRKDAGYNYSPTPYQQVYEADFTAFQTPGEYRLQVAGLGTSFAFLIDEGLAGLFARSYALGLYHQRCGFANDYPFTRHSKGACHTATAEVPDMTFSAVNAELSNMTGDYASSQSGAPQLKDVNSSLYPFVNKAKFNVTGGHHDAGDYSKYTINVAQLAHALVFAADSLPGVSELDNLGLPESSDGISDVLQEAKWELDFLAKLQDADGGFYFLVYPRNREYEGDVSLQGTDLGDSQVVFPKTTASTAASVAALAQAASSPLFKQYYPTEAANYLSQAKKGWQFLQNAWAKYGRAGAYQKITHYGNEFRDADEIAWAACELFLATGEAQYHNELLNTFNPADPNTRRWTWWRLFEGYGCAIRSYAFAARSGRLQASQLNATFLAKCEAEIIAAGDDQVRYSQNNAFGNSFPDPNKPYRSAGWFMSVEQTFDIATAYQLSAKQTYLDTIIANMNYEAGLNPLNMGFLTGIGWKRQRETVNQYAENDRRELPPSGIPLGSVASGPPYIYNYKSELAALCFPSDGASTAPYAPYEKWTDTFHTGTEMVNPQQGHSLAAMAFLMARTSLKTQPWRSATGTITGLPDSAPAQETVAAMLSVPGLDLSKASIVWEARDQAPTPASPFSFAAVNTGTQWVEAEALLPDGRRVFAQTNFSATTATSTPPNSYQASPLAISSDMVALYHLDSSLADATAKQCALTLAGSAALDSVNLGWMASRTGQALHTLNIGDKAVIATIPNSHLYSSDTTAIVLEAMVYINALKGANTANSPLVSLVRNWNSSIELYEDMYNGIKFRGGTQLDSGGATVANALSKNVWHHLRIAIDKTGYSAQVDGVTVISVASSELANWSGTAGSSTLTLGNFDGWIDEVTIRSVRSGTVTNSIVDAPAFSQNGGTFTNLATVALTTTTSGTTIRYTTDGTTPTSSSAIYASALTLSNSVTVKAYASKSGMTDSAVASANYVIVNSGSTSTNTTPTNLVSSATFLKTDTNAAGTWKGVYGSEGYIIVGNSSSNASYATLAPVGKSDWTWIASSAETRCLQKAGTATDRIAASWESPTSFTINVNLTDAKTHRLALYFLDWDRNGRVQTVEVLDTATGAILNSQSLSSFTEGKYLVWDIKGNVQVRLTRVTGYNATVQGVFLDTPATASTGTLKLQALNKTSNGQVQVNVTGTVGQIFQIQSSTNLLNWTTVSTNTLTSTNYSYTETSSATVGSRFYRAVVLP